MEQDLTKIWYIEESDSQLKITFFRKFEFGLVDTIVFLIVLVILLLSTIILLVTFHRISVFQIVVMFLLELLISRFLLYKIRHIKETHQIIITEDLITIIKKTSKHRLVQNLKRSEIDQIRMKPEDFSDEALLIDYAVGPITSFIPEAIDQHGIPAFFKGNHPYYFFEFGTKAQKMWIMKYIHHFLYN